jgi:uncharacterized membrane protein YedE/YeeE
MLTGGFLLGLMAGFLMHRSDYCIAGMFRDLFLFRSTRMVKSLLLFLAVSLPLFELIHLSGLVTFPFPKYGPPSGTNLLGGFLFGIGMVLAGGCAMGTLYKLGAGSFSALLAVIGLIIGSIFYAELYPVWSGIASSLALPVKAITVPELLSIPAWFVVAVLLLILLPLLWYWFRQGTMNGPMVVDGYLQPWKTALGLAMIGLTFVLLMGLPMGVTTSYAKFGAMLLQLLAPEHVAKLEYFNSTSLYYLPPLGGTLVIGKPGSAFDGVALVQFPLICGIIAGAAWSAIRLKEWRMQLRLPVRQVVSALVGGIIMGYASRMIPSCNVWHLFGGLPILGLQSLLFVAGMAPGAWVGGILLTRLVLPR